MNNSKFGKRSSKIGVNKIRKSKNKKTLSDIEKYQNVFIRVSLS